MLSTREGTMRMLRIAGVATLGLAMLGIAQASAVEDNNEDTTTTATSTNTITVTTSITSTFTKTRGSSLVATPTVPALTELAAPTDMTRLGKTYVLQGCFAIEGGADDIGLVLGHNYMTARASDMSLSLCLQDCASVVTGGSNVTYPFVGVADGSSCYCGTSLNTAAPQSNINDCTLPCAGSDTEACGGQGYMSVYRLESSDTTAQSPRTESSPASSASAIQTAGTHGSGAAYTENKDMDTSGAKSPGVVAGIAVGSVSGVGMLLFLLFVAARRLSHRRQAHAALLDVTAAHAASNHKTTKGIAARHSVASVETTSATVNTDDAASIRDAMRVDLRRLDGVVMDQQSPSVRPSSFARSLANDKKVAVEQIGVAATTGAEWRGGASPLTPRTPRYVGTDGAGGLEGGPRPSTPTIVVHPPDNIAPNYGLGERAWHRRRLSMEYSAVPVVELAAVVDDRRALPSQVVTQGKDLATDGMTGKQVVPAGEAEVVSASTGEGPVVESPSWQWTLSSPTEDEDEKAGMEAREAGERGCWIYDDD